MEKSKGKIVYIGGFELPDKNAAAHRVISNSKILRCLGYEVILIGVDKNNSDNYNFLKTKKNYFGFDTYSVKYPSNMAEFYNYITNTDDYLELFENFDDLKYIIMYNFPSILMKKIICYCKNNHIKAVTDVTEWYSARGNNLLYFMVKGLDTFYRMRFLNKKCDGVIAISCYLKNYYKKVNNVIYIPALTDINDDKWINDFKKSYNKLFLVYAGNPGKKDKINILIKSLKNVTRDYRLDVIGINKDDYLKNNKEDTSFLDSNNNIFFHGRLDHSLTLNYIKKSNYSVFFREKSRLSSAGFPTKFSEAISAGTPVITNNTSDLSIFISKEENGFLVNDLNYFSIAHVIDTVPNVFKVNTTLMDYHNYIDEMKKIFR